MGHRFRTSHALVVAFVLAACTKPEPIPQPPDVYNINQAPPGVDQQKWLASTPNGQACIVLDWLGCELPLVGDCEAALTVLVDETHTFAKSDLDCVRMSRTKDQVHTCNVQCP